MVQINLGGMTFGKNPFIKSIQYVTKALDVSDEGSDTATITSVNTENTVLVECGKSPTSDAGQSVNAKFELTNATTITFTNGNGTGTITFSIAVIEFQPGSVKSKQTGTISVTDGNTSNTDTITSVNTDKSLLIDNGASLSGTGTDAEANLPYFELTDDTTVTVTRSNSTNDMSAAYTVVEFY